MAFKAIREPAEREIIEDWRRLIEADQRHGRRRQRQGKSPHRRGPVFALGFESVQIAFALHRLLFGSSWTTITSAAPRQSAARRD